LRIPPSLNDDELVLVVDPLLSSALAADGAVVGARAQQPPQEQAVLARPKPVR
jgi:hypothetical protein